MSNKFFPSSFFTRKKLKFVTQKKVKSYFLISKVKLFKLKNMWRFIANVEKPVVKQQSAKTPRGKRRYLPKWETDFPWLTVKRSRINDEDGDGEEE